MITTNKICDRCGKENIQQEYTLAVHVMAVLPDGGGWSTGTELNARFDYCQQCKAKLTKELLDLLRRREG